VKHQELNSHYISFFLLDTSCPNGQCPIENVCSIRENNGFNCACFPGYYGTLCQIGFFFFFFK